MKNNPELNRQSSKNGIKHLVLTGLILTITANSQAETWLEEAFNSSGTMMNVTPGSSFSSQAANTISGGSVYMRTPQKNYQLINIQAPSISGLKGMGCGGIDIFTGSLSYISKKEFINMLRSIGQNAKGFAFKLALHSAAPEIENVVTGLESIAQKINAQTINSCEAAKFMVNGIADGLGVQREHEAAQWSKDFAAAGDYLTAKLDTFNNPQKAQEAKNKQIASLESGSDADKALAAELKSLEFGNLMWRSFTKNSPGMTYDEKMLLISITGTIIANNKNPNSEFKMDYKVPMLDL
jgi:conjugative transfer pilus assembly protein TraH